MEMEELRNNLTPSINMQVLNNYRRLRHIRRTNNLPTIQSEDVAQHSFYVAILATTLAEEYNQNVMLHNLEFHPLDIENTFDLVDVAAVTKQSLFHDMEEAFTSDIPWNVKHHNDETCAAIRNCVQDKLNIVFQGASGPVSQHKSTIFCAKFGLAGKFVNAADNLEGAWYCYSELKLGNQYLEPLFIKYLRVIRDDPFTATLKRFSPLFNQILNAFYAKLHMLKNENSSWDSMILD